MKPIERYTRIRNKFKRNRYRADQYMKVPERIVENLLLRLVREQQQRDNEIYAGNFIESSLVEHVYRYWMESVLAQLGFENIRREQIYESEATSKVRGRRDACDLVATYGSDEYWIEIKVAYWNTTYTFEELTGDARKLSSLTHDKKKVYLMIFVGMNDDVPDKMQAVLNGLDERIESKSLRNTSMPSPIDWRLPTTHLHVACILLR